MFFLSGEETFSLSVSKLNLQARPERYKFQFPYYTTPPPQKKIRCMILSMYHVIVSKHYIVAMLPFLISNLETLQSRKGYVAYS